MEPPTTAAATSPAEPLLTAPEVARRLHISLAQTYTLLQEGTIPGFRIGKSWRIDGRILAAWIDELARGSSSSSNGHAGPRP